VFLGDGYPNAGRGRVEFLIKNIFGSAELKSFGLALGLTKDQETVKRAERKPGEGEGEREREIRKATWSTTSCKASSSCSLCLHLSLN